MELLEVYYTSLDIGGVDAEGLMGTKEQHHSFLKGFSEWCCYGIIL